MTSPSGTRGLWHLGTLVPNYGLGLSAQGLGDSAKEAERLGYDSVWVTDHVAVPAAQVPTYGLIAEALVSLGYLAARTRTIQLGVSALVVPQRPLLLTAKQVMTAQLLSGGRMLLAVAAGWTAEEFANLGADMSRRGTRLRQWEELVQAISQCAPGRLDLDVPGLHIADAHIAPGFVDGCPPPTWIAGHGEAPLRRAARHGVWHPVGRPVRQVGELAKRFKEDCPEGKVVLRVIVTLTGQADVDAVDTDGRCRIVGPADFASEQLRRFQDAGVHGFVVDLLAGDGNLAERMETFVEEVRPHLDEPTVATLSRPSPPAPPNELHQ